jgi:hypothetical protein
MLAAELHVILPGADAENAKDVVRGAHMVCPYSNATRNNIEVKLSVTPSDGREYDVASGDRHRRQEAYVSNLDLD